MIKMNLFNKRKLIFWLLLVGFFASSTAFIYAANLGWPKISLNSPASFPIDI
jgi:hypothetical protein